MLTANATGDAVFDALTRPEAIKAWWNATSVTEAQKPNDELRIIYGSEPDPTVIHVLAAHRPNVVVWEVRDCPVVPDWAGTRPTFSISELAEGSRIDFAHHGLDAGLDCYERCAVDWGHFLSRIAAHAEA
jgi:uncharacterized protein YndB with AHSA1/START domain